MVIHGIDAIQPLLAGEAFQFKLIANDIGVVLFPCSTEHRDAGLPGIRYADDGQGNALAAMVRRGRIEFRFHPQFSDARVKSLALRILATDELAFARSFAVTYQGRLLKPAD